MPTIDTVGNWVRITLNGKVHVVEEQAPPFENVAADLERLQGYAPSNEQLAEIKKAAEAAKNNYDISEETEYKYAYIWMDEQQISYCVAKQLSTMNYIHTDYGDIPLDIEMQETIEQTLRELLERRLSEIEAIKKA
jgi:hypothetical protein